MGRVFLLFFSLILLLTPACGLLPDSEPATPASTVPAGTSTPATDAGTVGKGEKPVVAATDRDQGSRVAEQAEQAPTGAAWTILVYMNVAGDAEADALDALAEMRAGTNSDAINLLVQLGRDRENGGGASRYRVGAETAPDAASALPAELDSVEMGDPAVLADFITWGIDDYPATHYALLLWDPYGGGWQGLAVDAGGRAQLPAAALAEALTGLAPLDVVAFDAGRMGHLEIYQALQPHARFAVAPAAPLPGREGHYEELLADLSATPDMEPVALAQLLANTLAGPDEEEIAIAPAAMAVVDLAALPAVSEALDGLASALAQEPALVAAAVADARAGAVTNVVRSPVDEALAAAVDLGRFAQRLATRTPVVAIAGRARALQEAVTAAVIEADAASASSAGIAVYFPPDAATYQAAYGEVAFLPAWQQFLSAYHATGLKDGDQPGLEIVHLAGEVAGIEQPAYLDFELPARDVESVAIVAGQRGTDGALNLLAYHPRLPEAGFEQDRWRDGLHEGYFVWETLGGYLGDDDNGGFVLLWPMTPAENVYTVAGRLRQADGAPWRETSLIFDGGTGALAQVWIYRGAARRGAPRVFVPRPGDLFQVYDFYLEEAEGGSLRATPGLTLTFPATGTLRIQKRPLPQGEYELGVIAATRAGWTFAGTSLTLNNPEEPVPARAYLDPHRGFQFLYPADWQAPRYEQDRLVASSPDGESRLAITFYPESNPDAVASLKATVLQRFGAVDVLFEEGVFIGETAGTLTAYGYEAADEGRTGLFVTFVHQGIGYVVDVDGPVEHEAETIALVDRLIDSWLFRPLGVGEFPGQWTAPAQDDLPASVPVGYRYEALNNGWQRFSGDEGFVAFRHEPASGAGREEIVARWLAIAGDEVASFSPEPSASVALAGNWWARSNFTYEGASGSMRGFVMATIQGEEEIVAWAEASTATFDQLAAEISPVMVAEYLASRPGEPSLLYSASFSEAAVWGTGTVTGAEGRVTDGAYHLSAVAGQGFFWATAGKDFGDATYEVTATQTAGPLDDGYGLLLRADNDARAFYLFEISGDGYAWVGRCREGCSQSVSLHGEGWFPVPAVHTGLNTPNRLRVEADGSRLTFFVNDEEVAQISDSTLAAGDVGFFVETLGEGGVTVAFSDLRVLGN